MNKLKKGDIILTANDSGFIGDLISKFTGGKWTHSMIYVGEWRNQKMVLESTYGGVRYSTMKAYEDRDHCVLRSDLPRSKLEKILKSAALDIGKGYDYKGLIGYAISDIHYKITGKRRSYEDADKLFCSELIKHHYEHIGGLDLTGKPSCNTSPMDLYRSKELKIIR